MKIRSNFLLALGFLFGGLPALQAQYLPDTSLTYSRFLKQCQDFTRQQQAEAWIVNFWASYSTPSLNLLPRVQQAYEAYPNKSFRFIHISIDKNRSYWEQRLNYYKLGGEHLFLPSVDDYEFLRQAFRHGNLPALFVVYPNGDILRVADAAELAAEMKKLAPQVADRNNGPADPPPSAGTDPVDPASPPPPTRSDDDVPYITHTVRAGDTLFKLYRQYGVSVAEIKRYNGLRSDVIKPGQLLKIPK